MAAAFLRLQLANVVKTKNPVRLPFLENKPGFNLRIRSYLIDKLIITSLLKNAIDFMDHKLYNLNRF